MSLGRANQWNSARSSRHPAQGYCVGHGLDPDTLPPREGLDMHEEDATSMRTMTKQLCFHRVIEQAQLKTIARLEIENLHLFARAAVTTMGGRRKHMHLFSRSSEAGSLSPRGWQGGPS